MKRKLTGDQFGNRYPMLDPRVLAESLMRYADELTRGTNRSNILLTELPLRHEMVKIAGRPHGKDKDTIVTLLRGYRIYRVKRSEPNWAQLLAIFSRMTKCWHRVGFADLGAASALWNTREQFTEAGGYSLSDEALGQGPDSVPDHAMRRCLIIDTLPSEYRYFVALIARRQWDCCSWALCEAMKKCGLTVDADTPSPILLSRVLNFDRKALGSIWELIDRYGFPDGTLGETLQHMDKFRTF